MIDLESLPEPTSTHAVDHDTLMVRQHVFGYTVEDLKMIMMPMAVTGQEAIGSMGTDTPLACLNDKPQLLYAYFRQLFAQVTNPPLDAIREALVTSMYTYLGRGGSQLDETRKHAPSIKPKCPVISNDEWEKLRGVAVGDLKSVTLPMLFNVADGEAGMHRALEELLVKAAEAVKDGA